MWSSLIEKEEGREREGEREREKEKEGGRERKRERGGGREGEGGREGGEKDLQRFINISTLNQDQRETVDIYVCI